MSMLFLQLVNGLEVAIQILATVSPRVSRVVNFLVCPSIRQKDFSSIWLEICKGVKDVSADL